MELNIIISPEDECISTDAALASPMSKHQRKLSLSAKWASNKALALEYLKRQRELILWMEQILGDKLPATDLHEALRSGIVLRELQEKLFPDTTRCLSPISRNYSSRMAPWKERENISVFLKQCKTLGMNDLSLFCTDDLYDGNNMVQVSISLPSDQDVRREASFSAFLRVVGLHQVMFCVQHFMQFSQEHSVHSFHPVYDEHMTFSNQEVRCFAVEMALSKIEKAGMDAGMLKDMMTGSSSPQKQKANGASEDSEDTDADSSLASSDSDADSADPVENDEMTLKELESELCGLDGTERCNQLSDIKAAQDEGGKGDLDPESDDEVESESGVDIEGEIVDVLDQILDAVEAVQIAELAAAENTEEMECSVDARFQASLEEDLEDAKRERLPDTQVSEILEPEFLTNISADHRLESGAKTELMDVGKSDTTVVDGTAGEHSHRAPGRSESAAEQDSKASKKKRAKAAKKKKNRELSDEQLDAEAMSRCTCGSKCSIM